MFQPTNQDKVWNTKTLQGRGQEKLKALRATTKSCRIHCILSLRDMYGIRYPKKVLWKKHSFWAHCEKGQTSEQASKQAGRQASKPAGRGKQAMQESMIQSDYLSKCNDFVTWELYGYGLTIQTVSAEQSGATDIGQTWSNAVYYGRSSHTRG